MNFQLELTANAVFNRDINSIYSIYNNSIYKKPTVTSRMINEFLAFAVFNGLSVTV